MKIKEEFLKNNNNNFNSKKYIYLQTTSNKRNMSLRISQNKPIHNSYSNNITSSINNSYFNNNKPQIIQDIIGYNNYIFTESNINTCINIPEVPKKNICGLYNKNNLNLTISNYLKNAVQKNNYKIKNKKINTLNNSNNYTSSFFNNDDIDYMNLKLNFKLLEQKLSHLNNIISTNDKNNNKYTSKSTNNISNLSYMNQNILIENKADNYSNHKIKKILKMKNNENINQRNNTIEKEIFSDINNQQKILKIKVNKISKYNTNIKINKHKRPINLKNIDCFNYFDRNLNNLKSKESENLSEIADDIVDIMNENIDNKKSYKKINDKRRKMKNNTNINNIKKSKKIIKNQTNQINTNINKTEYIISNLPVIFYNPNNLNINKKNNLIVEHVFDYNHFDIDNKKSKEQENITTINNDNDVIKDVKNEHLKNNDNINDDNINDDNKNALKDEEGEIIDSLLAQISQDIKNEKEKQNNQLNKELDLNLKDFNCENESQQKEKNIDSINSKKIQKKVTFDDNLIYINYNQKSKVTNLHISDKNDKPLQFKSIDISKYLKNITSSNTNINKIKSIMLNSSKIDYNEIINNIKNKSNNIQKNKIIKNNVDYIKVAKKTGNLYNNSKEKKKKENLSK